MKILFRTLPLLFLAVWTAGGCDHRTPPADTAPPTRDSAAGREETPATEPELTGPGRREPPPAQGAVVDAAVERVKAIGGRVRREGAKIVAVQFDATPARDDDVEMIAALKDLEQLVLRGEEITDASAGHIASLAKLRTWRWKGHASPTPAWRSSSSLPACGGWAYAPHR